MQRTYRYKGFEVSVELVAVWTSMGRSTPAPLAGYIAVVQITRPGSTRPVGEPIRLETSAQRPFPTEADALMAAYSAGQRVVDDTLMPRRSPDPPSK